MKKWIVTLVAIVLLLALAGCDAMNENNNSHSIGGEQEKMIDDHNEDDEKNSNSSDDGTTTHSNQSSQSGSGWPAGLNGIPVFTYGDIIKVEDMSETYEGTEFISYNIIFENVQEDAGEKYAEDLIEAGFRESEPPNTYTMSINNTVVTEYGHDKRVFETDDTIYSIQVDHWTNDAGDGSVYISIPLDPGNGQPGIENDNNQNDAKETDDDNEPESGFNFDTLSDSEIPEGYPGDVIPIIGMDSADILGSSKQTMGDEGTAFVIVFGINETVEDVIDTIQEGTEKHVTDKGGAFNVVAGQLMMGTVDNVDYTIAIGDGTADGYTATVTYTVIVNNK